MKRMIPLLCAVLLLFSCALAAPEGALTLQCTPLPFAEPLTVDSSASGRVAAAGQSVYVLSDGVLLRCSRAGEGLQIEERVELPALYTELQGGGANAYLSSAAHDAPLLALDAQGGMTELPGDCGVLAVAPSGGTGVAWVGGISVTPVTLTRDAVVPGASTAIPAALRSVNRVFVSDEHIFFCGVSKETGFQAVCVCDPSGEALFTLGGTPLGLDGCMLYVHALAETETAVAAFDSRLDTMNVWDKRGIFVAGFEARELFGADAVVTGCQALPGGRLLVCAEADGELSVWEIAGLDAVPAIEPEAEEPLTVELELPDELPQVGAELLADSMDAETDGEAAAVAEMPEEIESTPAEEAVEAPAAEPLLEICNATTNVNFRSGPSGQSKKIGSLAPGEKVADLGEITAGFRKVRYGEQEGYISVDYLRPAE